MIDVIGFWSSVTLIIGLPFWFFGYRITRGILSIAKKSAPELPRELRIERRYVSGYFDWHLYPRWAHNLNRMFGGGFLGTGSVLILGVVAAIPSFLLFIGAFHPNETVVGVVSMIAESTAHMMGWLALVVSVLGGGYFGVSKGSRLIGLIQIQEMKEKKRD